MTIDNNNLPPSDPPDNEQPPNGESTPRDDSGINNDHILDLCDFIINSAWMKYIGNSTGSSPSIRELECLANTIQNVWILAQEIIDLDRRLRLVADFGDLPPGFFDDSDEDDDSDDGDDDE
jgi:hypothetical protein